MKDKLPDKKFDTLKKISVPWLCLLCPAGLNTTSGDSAPDRVATAFQLLTRHTMEAGGLSRPSSPDYSNLIRSEPPPYFSALRRLEHVDTEAQKVPIIETLAAQNPEIDGIVLITDRNDGGPTDAGTG